MFSASTLIAYIAACFVFSIIPGPSVTAVIANSLAYGVRAGLLIILGTEISMLSMVFVVALGLELVVQLVGEAFVWIKLVGAAYLVWLGYKMLRSQGRVNLEHKNASPSPTALVIQGALINWSNPKTLLFLGAFLPQFVSQEQTGFSSIFILGLIVMAVATITDCAYAALAASARTFMSQSRLRLMNRVAGLVLISGGVWLALQERLT